MRRATTPWVITSRTTVGVPFVASSKGSAVTIGHFQAAASCRASHGPSGPETLPRGANPPPWTTSAPGRTRAITHKLSSLRVTGADAPMGRRPGPDGPFARSGAYGSLSV
ncbi:hypothetical protein GCM10009646_57190 [Streptomyces aureus]